MPGTGFSSTSSTHVGLPLEGGTYCKTCLLANKWFDMQALTTTCSTISLNWHPTSGAKSTRLFQHKAISSTAV